MSQQQQQPLLTIPFHVHALSSSTGRGGEAEESTMRLSERTVVLRRKSSEKSSSDYYYQPTPPKVSDETLRLTVKVHSQQQPSERVSAFTIEAVRASNTTPATNNNNNKVGGALSALTTTTSANALSVQDVVNVASITTDTVIAVEVLPVGEGDNLYALALTNIGRIHVLRLEMAAAGGTSSLSSTQPKRLVVSVIQSVDVPSHCGGASPSPKGVPVALTVSSVPCPKATNCSLNLCPFTVVYRSNTDVAIHRAASSPTAPWGAASGSPIGGGGSDKKSKYSFKSAPVGTSSQPHAQDTMAVMEYSLLPGVVDIVSVDTSMVYLSSVCTPMKQVRQAIDVLSITLDVGYHIVPATISPKCITRNRTSTTFGWEVVLGVHRGPKYVVDAASAQGVVIDGSLTKRGDIGRCVIKAVISHDVDEDEKDKVEEQIEFDATEKMPFGAALENESYMADTNSPFLCAAGNPRSTVPSFFHSGGKPPIQQRKGNNFTTTSSASTATPIDDQIAVDAVVAVQHLDIATPNNAPLIMYTLPKVVLIVDTKFSGGKSVIGIVNPPRSMGKGASIVAASIMVDYNENTCVCSLVVRGADRRLFKCDNIIKFENDHTEECIKISSIVCTSTTKLPTTQGNSLPSTSIVGEDQQRQQPKMNPQVLVGLVQIPARTPSSELVCKLVPSTIPGLPRLDSSGNFTVWAAISEREGANSDCVSLVDYYGTMTHSTPPANSIPLSLSSPTRGGDTPEVVTSAKVVYEGGKLVCAVGYESGRISFWESEMDVQGGTISPPTLKYDRQLHDGAVSHLVYVGNSPTRTSSDFRFISVSTSCGSVCLHRSADYVRFGMLGGFSVDDLIGLYLDPPADYCLLINRSGMGTLYHTMSGRIDRIIHNHSEASAHMAGKINLLVSSGSLEHGGGCLSVRNDTLIVNPILAIEQHIQGKQSVPVTVALGYAMGALNPDTIRKHLGVAFSFPLANHKALKGNNSSTTTTNKTTTTVSSIHEGMVSLVVALASYSAVAGSTSDIPSDLIPDDWLSATLQPHAAGLNDFLQCNREQSALLVKLVDALRPMMSASDEMLAAAIALIRSALLKLSRGTLCNSCRGASKEHAALPLELFASTLVPNDDNREFFLNTMGARDPHSNLSRADEMMRFMRVVAACLIQCRTDREVEVVKQYTHEVEKEIKSLCADVQGVGLGLVAFNWGEFYKRCRDSPALMEAVLASGWEANNLQSRKALLHMFSILLTNPVGYEHAWMSIGRWFKATPTLRAPILKFLVNLVQRYPGTMVATNSITQILSYVWHALDPHNPNKAERDQTIPIATQFFRVAVGTIPTLCFHQKSQRVVLGKPDGHISLFDAKSTDEVATFAAFTPASGTQQKSQQTICSLQAHSIIAVGYLTSSHDIAVLPADLSCVKIFSPVSTSTVGSFFAFVSSSAHSHYKLKKTVALDTPASLAVVSSSVAIGCNVVWLSPVCVEVTSPYHDRVQLVIPA